MRQTLNASGAVTAVASYDPWGAPVAGMIAPFGFTGEVQDAAGQVYLRARWYNAAHGTFTSRDPFAGWAEQPYSLQYYQYGYSDPVLNTDPTGRVIPIPVSCLPFYTLDPKDQLCHRDPGAPSWFPETIDPMASMILPGPPLGTVARVGGSLTGGLISGGSQAASKAVAGLLICANIIKGVQDLTRDRAEPQERDNRDEWSFVGYHGTSSVHAPSILAGINPPDTNVFGNQLGEGFYVTPDLGLAKKFAAAATGLLEIEGQEGGQPVVLKIFAHNFTQMTRKVIPVSTIDIPYDYITGYDYLMSEIAGFEPAIQFKFNPRAYTRLRASL